MHTVTWALQYSKYFMIRVGSNHSGLLFLSCACGSDPMITDVITSHSDMTPDALDWGIERNVNPAELQYEDIACLKCSSAGFTFLSIPQSRASGVMDE